MGGGRCIAGCGRGQVYKCEWGCDHCSVLGGCLLLLSLCISGFPGSDEVTRLPLAPPSACQNPVRYK